MIDEWMLRLKAAYDAGYYGTEAVPENQSAFPWQGKTCLDCPFWSDEICRVYSERRSAQAHTCTYFDESNQQAGRRIIETRVQNRQRTWWEHFGR